MEREALKDILLIQDKVKKERIVERELMVRIKELADTPFVIIISGVRRCGKSTLLNEIKTTDCYYVNFDDERFIDFSVRDFQTMYELLIELFGEKETFLFDEIQNIEGWERFVRRLHDDGKKIYVTGSNATMLSRELGTHLTGRNISLSLYPFSFKEFLKFRHAEIPKLDRMTSKEKAYSRERSMNILKRGASQNTCRQGKMTI